MLISNTNINIHLRDLLRLLLFIIVRIKAKQQNIYNIKQYNECVAHVPFLFTPTYYSPEFSNYISFFNKNLIFLKKSSFSSCFF